MKTKIDLCSQALLKIGENAISSFNEQTTAAEIAKGLYDITVDSLLCSHVWRFATKTFALSKTTDGDFIIPAEALRIISCSAPRFKIAGNRISSNADEIEISAVARVPEGEFPSHFSRVLVTKLAMEFSIPLTGNQNTYAMMNAVLDADLRQAKFIDSSMDSGSAIGVFPLVSARF